MDDREKPTLAVTHIIHIKGFAINSKADVAPLYSVIHIFMMYNFIRAFLINLLHITGEAVIKRIEEWIEDTNREFQSQRRSCTALEKTFAGFYPSKFLREPYFVVIDDIPKPNFPELRELGLSNFIDMPVNGITYKDTYYVGENQANDLRLHFHELVHVAQWGILGASKFISRYINEIQNYGYDSAPLEQMAYALDNHYISGGVHLDVPGYVRSNL